MKTIHPDMLRHRIILAYEAEAQSVTSDAIVKKILNAVPVPLRKGDDMKYFICPTVKPHHSHGEDSTKT